MVFREISICGSQSLRLLFAFGFSTRLIFISSLIWEDRKTTTCCCRIKLEKQGGEHIILSNMYRCPLVTSVGRISAQNVQLLINLSFNEYQRSFKDLNFLLWFKQISGLTKQRVQWLTQTSLAGCWFKPQTHFRKKKQQPWDFSFSELDYFYD